ncbi:hypothetical protein KC332_g9962 [Hortaea werneckii]|uniref:Stress response RCI peptide n=2 Tax=Hortaea werneckii TaxID=91943 RepID=A0A3M7IMU8_HORWE|nr:hypothetical protein KC358_g9866 [Hortaea werneckii]OTA29639.1 hypothetical protein BTJ68_09524 [Hortaea werneckii EXF-2000]KAI6824140.1 hypothetical protein KC350_g9079 [Hortaea werneckii]KAI6921876.1 hypothetical protein KC348_g9985 [Hortaea werneckii]KAI6926937.1 hypothetical protein KC341_g12471 [Hortaea werneckii]
MCGTDVFLGILAIIFPPIAVWVKRGLCSADSLINLALCCLGFLPGLLHAWYIIFTYPDPTYEELAQHDAEQGHHGDSGGTVTYYYVQQHQGQPQYSAPTARSQAGYGTVNATPNAQFPAAQGQGFVPSAAAQAGGSSGDGEAPPPSYQQATGDHKVQRS